jgi:hypothetical protein
VTVTHVKQRAEGGKRSARFLIVAAAALALAACAQPPALHYENGAVTATGWTSGEPKEGWESVLSVRAGEDPAAPAILGDYAYSGGTIKFTPRFPPSPGVRLYVTFRAGKGAPLTGSYGEAAKAVTPTTKVAAIYPTTDEWPANLLRMYIEFSGPMAAGEAYAHVTVRDEKGRVIDAPFVAFDQELWDPSGTRLTILFDPGRIKRGLTDNMVEGPPLVPGRTVTIEVSSAWRDADGAPLAERFVRTIHVAEALRAALDPKRWQVTSPNSTRGDLVIAFDRPLDHALAERAIGVQRNGAPVAGKVSLEANDTRWRFTPARPWSKGAHFIVVDGILEDVAGNRPGKLFDVDTADKTQSTSATPSTAIPFTAP